MKMNEPRMINPEAEFLTAYQHLDLLPKLVFVDPSYEFMVYAYIRGSTGHFYRNKKKVLRTLAAELINQYQASSIESWGWQDAPVNSWAQFLSMEVHEATKILTPFLKKENLYAPAPLPLDSVQDRFSSKPYLIHGDCGIHNFIFQEDRLIGVIDPTPAFGFPHYDLIYAFFSSPVELTKDVLDSAISLLSSDLPDSKQLYEEVLIGLYQRMSLSVKHHPADFPKYLEAWNYWREIIRKL